MRAGGGRPKGGYFADDGEKVTSVTTITGRGKDFGGLIYVAKKKWHEAGRKGLPFERDAYWSDVDALQAGSLVHDWIEADLHSRQPETPSDASGELLEQAETGFNAYKKWRAQTDLEVVATEIPLVSEVYRYGGTIDAVAKVAGDLVLVDWKTSNATYQDYIAQLAAYRQLWNETVDPWEWGEISEAYLLRVGKEYGDFHVHSWPSEVLDDGFKWFLAAKQLVELDRKLKKVAA